MTELLRNRIKVLKQRVVWLTLRSSVDHCDDVSRELVDVFDFLDGIIDDVQKPLDDQPDYHEL